MTNDTGYAIMRAVGGIDEDLIEGAEKEGTDKRRKRRVRAGWAAAAALTLVIGLGAFTLWADPWAKAPETSVPVTESEAVFESRYVYRVDSGAFAAYAPGKVIDAAKVGEKLEDVNVNAAWQHSDGRREGEESLRAEAFRIKDIPAETAVCLRFLDKGDALTTDHYYVLINMSADTAAVREYIIPEAPADPLLE